MKKFIIMIVACLYATGALAFDYPVNNNTDGDIVVTFAAIGRAAYELPVKAKATAILKTSTIPNLGYCIRGITVVGKTGSVAGKKSDYKLVPGSVCKGYTISVHPAPETILGFNIVYS